MNLQEKSVLYARDFSVQVAIKNNIDIVMSVRLNLVMNVLVLKKHVRYVLIFKVIELVKHLQTLNSLNDKEVDPENNNQAV